MADQGSTGGLLGGSGGVEEARGEIPALTNMDEEEGCGGGRRRRQCCS